MKQLLETYLKDKVNQFAEIDLNDVVLSEDMRKYCAANHCGKYNTNWMCPPGLANFEELMKEYKQFNQGFVFNQVTYLEDSFDIEGMEQGRINLENLIKDLRKVLKEFSNYAIIGVGSCNICTTCTYPDNPCRFPKLAIPSMEAIGINVASLAELGKMRYHNGPNTVTYFAMVVY